MTPLTVTSGFETVVVPSPSTVTMLEEVSVTAPVLVTTRLLPTVVAPKVVASFVLALLIGVQAAGRDEITADVDRALRCAAVGELAEQQTTAGCDRVAHAIAAAIGPLLWVLVAPLAVTVSGVMNDRNSG